MIKLTKDQYATAFLAASNLRTTVHNKNPYDYLPYEQQLIGYATMLTGSCPSDATIKEAVALAKTFLYDDRRNDIDKIIEVYIGPFEHEPIKA